MTMDEAHYIADLASPMPYKARQALALFREQLEASTTLLSQIRDHAGVTCAVEDLPEAVADLRRQVELRR